jgi:hypothetical protein
MLTCATLETGINAIAFSQFVENAQEKIEGSGGLTAKRRRPPPHR